MALPQLANKRQLAHCKQRVTLLLYTDRMEQAGLEAKITFDTKEGDAY